MAKLKTIDSFFKKKIVDSSTDVPNCNTETPPTPNVQPSKIPRVDCQEVDTCSLERDSGKHPQIWEYPINQRDEIRRAYIRHGAYQFLLAKYPASGSENHPRRFQSSWFNTFAWLEYSPSKDAAYCFPCYVFSKKPTNKPGANAFTIEGFRNWKKVNDGTKCAFLVHMGNLGKDPCSLQNNAVKCCDVLIKQSQHIDTVMERLSDEEKRNNRLRLKATIDGIRWLAFQACAFRGHDERPESKNRGCEIRSVKTLVIRNFAYLWMKLEMSPKESKWHLFCDLFDKEGFLKERFFDLVHVKDTSSLTLKNEICKVLARNNINVQNMRGQGYDGASNMRGKLNGLQALFLNECPYAYYVHCMAHRLQLALVAASREVIPVHYFFSKLSSIVNIVGGSCKRNDELQAAQSEEIAHLIAFDDLETGRGQNQIGTLQRAGDTRWSSHFTSICSLIRMYGATCTVLKRIINDKKSGFVQRGDADSAYDTLTSFDFVFIMHLMRDIMGITDILCQALQQKVQDITNAMHLVITTKGLILKLREDGWENLFGDVKDFCDRYEIEILDMNARYVEGRGQDYNQQHHTTIEYHYREDIFSATITSQLKELSRKFTEKTMELLSLSSRLDPRNDYRSFEVNDICILAEKFYPQDFTEQEKIHLRYQLQHFELNVPHHPDLKNLSTISELCRGLVETEKSKTYHLVHILIVLILTLPVSTATTERAFSTMSIVKTTLRNKMEDELLAACLIIYIEKEMAENITTDMIIDDFNLGRRRVKL